MGSLLPGWNESAPGVAPKEFQDFKEEEDELGYFAQLKSKRMQRQEQGLSEVQSAPITISRRNSMPLGRSSMPLNHDSVPLTPTSSRSFKDSSPAFGSFKPPPPLQRMTSMPVTSGDFDILAPWTPKTPKTPKGQLSPKSPSSFASGVGSPHSLDAYKTQREDKPNYQWWRHLDSAALNEVPDVPVSKDKGYVPQFKAAGQVMHYRGVEEGAPAVIKAQ